MVFKNSKINDGQTSEPAVKAAVITAEEAVKASGELPAVMEQVAKSGGTVSISMQMDSVPTVLSVGGFPGIAYNYDAESGTLTVTGSAAEVQELIELLQMNFNLNLQTVKVMAVVEQEAVSVGIAEEIEEKSGVVVKKHGTSSHDDGDVELGAKKHSTPQEHQAEQEHVEARHSGSSTMFRTVTEQVATDEGHESSSYDTTLRPSVQVYHDYHGGNLPDLAVSSYSSEIGTLSPVAKIGYAYQPIVSSPSEPTTPTPPPVNGGGTPPVDTGTGGGEDTVDSGGGIGGGGGGGGTSYAPPVITSGISILESQIGAYSHNITATDPAGLPLTLSVNGSPGWLTLTDNGDGTGSLSGVAGAGERGFNTFTVRALNSAGEYVEQTSSVFIADTVLGSGSELSAFWGAATDDYIAGGAGDDTILDAGNDVIFGGEGSDIIGGVGANVQLYGGAGADIYWGHFIAGGTTTINDFDVTTETILASMADRIVAQGTSTEVGQLEYRYSGGNMIIEDVQFGSGFQLIIEGYTGSINDINFGYDFTGVGTSGADNFDMGALGTVGLVTFAGNDTVIGSTDADDINTGDGNDSITSGDGTDIIMAGAGNDTINGENDNDNIFAGSGSDTVDGGAGDDYVNLGSGGDVYGIVFGADSVFGGADDTMMSNLGNDLVSGGAGDDTIVDAAGDNTLQGGDGADTILAGGVGTSQLVEGNAGDDYLASVFSGTSTLVGGGGNDTLVGVSTGADVYKFVGLDGHDQINTFTNGTDKIDLTAFATNWVTVQAGVSMVDADGSGGANDTRIVLSDGTTIDLLSFNSASLDATDFQF